MGIIQRQTLRGTAFTYAGIGIGFLIAGILQPNLLTKPQNGLIGLLLSVTVILTQFSGLGINSAGGRYFPYFRDYDRAHNGYLPLALLVTFVGFCISVGVLWWFQPWIVATNVQKSPLFAEYYFLLIPLTFCLLFFNLFDNYAKLLYDPVTGTVLQQFVQRILFLAVLTAYGVGWIGFQTLLGLWLLTFALPLVLMLVSVVQDGHFSLNISGLRLDPMLRREFVRYAGLTLLTGLSSQVILHIDKILVNDALGLSQTGVYTILSNFGAVIAAPATMLYKVSGVIIADSWKRDDRANIADIYRKSCLSQLVAGTLVFVGIMANLPAVFRLLPAGYEAGYWVVFWIGLGKLIDMATGVNGTILNTSSRYAWDSAFFLLMVVATILVTRALIPVYGLNGAALGAALATAGFNLLRTGFVWQVFGLQPFSWRNAVVPLLGLAVWWLATRWPYATGPLWQVGLDMAIRSVVVAGLFVGAVRALHLSPDISALLDGAWARAIRRGGVK
jgi:O-antigen/teichoic acid export membrane protein